MEAPRQIISSSEQGAPYKNEIPLPHDMWGVSIIIVVKDFPDILAGDARKLQWLRFVYCVVTCALNVVVQCFILYWVRQYVSVASIVSIQRHYKEFHSVAFNEDGVLDDARWADFPYKEELCEAVIGNAPFICVVLFFWTARIMAEFKEIERIAGALWYVPALQQGHLASDMVHEEVVHGETNEDLYEVDETLKIVALDKCTRVTLYLLVAAPRIGIAFFLLFMGCQWLMSTEHYQDLILNTLALEFVVRIDEIFYEAYFPSSFRVMMEKTSFQLAATNLHAANEKTFVEILKNIVYLTVCVGYVFMYYFFLQGVLPGFQHDINTPCHKFQVSRGGIICPHFDNNCFPFGTGSQ